LSLALAGEYWAFQDLEATPSRLLSILDGFIPRRRPAPGDIPRVRPLWNARLFQLPFHPIDLSLTISFVCPVTGVRIEFPLLSFFLFLRSPDPLTRRQSIAMKFLCRIRIAAQ
jgi:hypothetical protein